MELSENNYRRNSFIFAVFLLALVFGYYYFFLNRTYVQLDIEVDYRTDFKMYWADEQELFSESRSIRILLNPNQSHYEFFLTDLGKVDRLRIDPMEFVGGALLKKIEFEQTGFKTISIDLTKLQPLNHVAQATYEQGTGLRVVSSGNDPNFLLIPEMKPAAVDWALELSRLLLLGLITLTIIWVCSPLRRNFAYVTTMLAMIFFLIVTMAAVSERNVHPDENVHLSATEYYEEHWLPPRIDDPAISHTYSPYGYSRLNNGEVYYFLAGKLARLIEILRIDEPFSLRLFNITLFALIILYSFHSIPARLVALPLLLTPQVWYVFSYCNSDAFALFVCFIAGSQIVSPRSFLNTLLQKGNSRSIIVSTVIVASLLALLFLLKKNFYPVGALIYLIVLWHIFRTNDKEERRLYLKRFIVVTVLAVCLAGLRIGTDYYVNGIDRQEKLAAMQEERAEYSFKASTELNQKHLFLSMRDRGKTLEEMMVLDKWPAKTFVTGFGSYGYFTIGGSYVYYDTMKWAAALLLIYILTMVFWQGGLENRLIALMAVGLSVALICASIYHSWTMDFQTQGRYLFPILSMLGIVLGKAREIFDRRLLIVGTSQMYLLGIYSFIFLALTFIPRHL